MPYEICWHLNDATLNYAFITHPHTYTHTTQHTTHDTQYNTCIEPQVVDLLKAEEGKYGADNRIRAAACCAEIVRSQVHTIHHTQYLGRTEW
jgi:hypothetical protein